jgi:hypothetical protein
MRRSWLARGASRGSASRGVRACTCFRGLGAGGWVGRVGVGRRQDGSEEPDVNEADLPSAQLARNFPLLEKSMSRIGAV